MQGKPTPTHRRFDRPPTEVAGARVLVVGLGRFGGGVGVSRWLVEQGAQVTVTDQADQGALRESVQRLADCDLSWRLGGHNTADLDDVDFVVVNPGVDKRNSSFFQEILERRLSWTTEINLFCERCAGMVVGVTGSFGKSTTCAMLAAVL
ncbi:MAG: UDP-N-acetylmuramoyl-L-alanine--D-glutamate ligase, partial [Planctomycetes bacterium]|nr:UDP-N-acetylmuramoyl-L-alanine--D-glutamate ligase [Planctomycetota bacterium]